MMSDVRLYEHERLYQAKRDAAAEFYDALAVIVANASLIPDPAMNGLTDCCTVPIDDIETAIATLAKARGDTPNVSGLSHTGVDRG